MFPLGIGAAVKLDIDITSEFMLLPDAPIQVDQSLIILIILGIPLIHLLPSPPMLGKSRQNRRFLMRASGCDTHARRNGSIDRDAPFKDCISKCFLISSRR